jgi:hypothetical protein
LDFEKCAYKPLPSVPSIPLSRARSLMEMKAFMLAAVTAFLSAAAALCMHMCIVQKFLRCLAIKEIHVNFPSLAARCMSFMSSPVDLFCCLFFYDNGWGTMGGKRVIFYGTTSAQVAVFLFLHFISIRNVCVFV